MVLLHLHIFRVPKFQFARATSIQFKQTFSYSTMSTHDEWKKATFGAGCFWGTEKFFKKQFAPNVKTAVGYMGGKKSEPSYQQVCTGQTGHAEVLHLEYDPKNVSYDDLLTFFWRMHDPTTPNRQGNDVGTQYRSVVFYHDEEQREQAEKKKKEIDAKGVFKNPIATTIEPAGQFWSAEDYHQDYLEKNPGGYCNHKIRW